MGRRARPRIAHGWVKSSLSFVFRGGWLNCQAKTVQIFVEAKSNSAVGHIPTHAGFISIHQQGITVRPDGVIACGGQGPKDRIGKKCGIPIHVDICTGAVAVGRWKNADQMFHFAAQLDEATLRKSG
jgi:hypothetical protein